MDKQEILIEAYKTHSSHSQNLMQIREAINAFNIVFHAFFIPFANNQSNWIFLLFGVIIAILWSLKISYLLDLNKAKIKVLSEMEKTLDFDFYDKEWEYMQKNKLFGFEISLGKITKILPWTIILIYITIMLARFDINFNIKAKEPNVNNNPISSRQ